MRINIPAQPYTLAQLRLYACVITSPGVNIGSGPSNALPRLYLAYETWRDARTKHSPDDTAQGPALMRSIVVLIG